MWSSKNINVYMYVYVTTNWKYHRLLISAMKSTRTTSWKVKTRMNKTLVSFGHSRTKTTIGALRNIAGVASSSSPKEFIGMLHQKGLTCQRSLKCYCTGLLWGFYKLSYVLICLACVRTTRTLKSHMNVPPNIADALSLMTAPLATIFGSANQQSFPLRVYPARARATLCAFRC